MLNFYNLINNKDFKPNILINENTSNELNTLLYGHSFNYSFRNIDSDYHYVVNVDRDGSGHNFNSYIFCLTIISSFYSFGTFGFLNLFNSVFHR